MTTPFGRRRCRARLVVVSTDLPARAMLLNMKHHNGKCFCLFCEQEGTSFDENPMHRYWPYELRRLRTHQSVVGHAVAALERDEAVCGLHY